MAVLFYAFVVRLTIVPAVMALLGRSAWWLPDWLGRLLPRMDLDGGGGDPGRDGAPAPAPVAVGGTEG